MDDVVTFSTPGDVVGVAEGVDLEGADVRWKEGKVLGCGCEHMPGVEVEEGHEEVEANCGTGRNDEISEDVVADNQGRGWALELGDHDVEGCEGGVRHDDRVNHET